MIYKALQVVSIYLADGQMEVFQEVLADLKINIIMESISVPLFYQ